MTGADPGPGIFWWRGDEALLRAHDAGQAPAVSGVRRPGAQDRHPQRQGQPDGAGERGRAAVRRGPGGHRWSAQNYRSADGLPYIGRDFSGCFIATGFSTDGLVWGTVAAQIIAGQIDGPIIRIRRAVQAGTLLACQGRQDDAAGSGHDDDVAGQGLPDPPPGTAAVEPGAAATARSSKPRANRSRPTAHPMASCSPCRRSARTWAARCTGTAWKPAGTAPATAAGSGRTGP